MQDIQEPADQTLVQAGEETERAPITADESWLEDSGELPARPRRRILTPAPVALFALLAVACGFIAGVLVEKGQGGSATAGGGPSALATRLAGRSISTSGSGSSATSGTGAAAAGGAGGLGPGGGARGAIAAGATIGQVAYLSGSTLYVTTLEGNTVKVTAAPGASVTKTVAAHVRAIHPGETVVISGSARANGVFAADSIRAGGAGASGLGVGSGGRASLFGASGASSGSAASSARGASTGAGGSNAAGAAPGEGGPALFGKE